MWSPDLLPPPKLCKSTLALWVLTSVECPAWLLLTLDTGKSYTQCSQVQAKSWWTTLEFFFLLIVKVGLAFIMKPYRCFWKVSTALILAPSNMGLSSKTQVAQWESATCLPWREPGKGVVWVLTCPEYKIIPCGAPRRWRIGTGNGGDLPSLWTAQFLGTNIFCSFLALCPPKITPNCKACRRGNAQRPSRESVAVNC